jgi:HlyD family secretion protein
MIHVRDGTRLDRRPLIVDRPLDSSARRRASLRKSVVPIACVLGVSAILLLLPGWMRPVVVRARIRTARVVKGAIESTISASGLVVPEVERVVSSPLDANVTRILKRPGARVKEGDPVLMLDVSGSILALERIVTDQQIKDNQQAQVRLALDKAVTDLDGRIRVKTLQLESAQTRFRSSQTLVRQGLLAREALDQADLAVRQSEIELTELREERRSAEHSMTLQSEGLTLERTALDREAIEARRVLELATTKSDRDGVLTWVFEQEGGTVRKGDVIARIADLQSFRVDASVSDVHVDSLRAGTPVMVKAGDAHLDGTISQVFPTIDNGIVRFTVALTERAHPALRPNLRVDVLIITDRKPHTLTVKRGPFADGSGPRQAFVVRGTRAVRLPIELGLFGFDDVEVLSGLHDGDEVIVSDMRDYLHLKEISLK